MVELRVTVDVVVDVGVVVAVGAVVVVVVVVGVDGIDAVACCSVFYATEVQSRACSRIHREGYRAMCLTASMFAI